MDKHIHVGDRVRPAPDAPMADKGLGTAGPITLSAYEIDHWDMVGVAWDDGGISTEMRGHLVKVKPSAA